MTFGKMKKIINKITLLLLILFFTAPAYALEAKKLKLIELLHLFAQQQQSTVDFEEEKYASYLDEPIKSSGYLQFSAPNKLYKFILKPEKISQKIDGNEMKINKENHITTINLNDYPELSIILRSIISLLSGNHSALKKDFKITFENKTSNWLLTLVPHDNNILRHVASIKMSGYKNKLTKIIITEPKNDRSITNLYNHR